MLSGLSVATYVAGLSNDSGTNRSKLTVAKSPVILPECPRRANGAGPAGTLTP